MTRAAIEASQHEQANTDGESRFIRTNTCHPIPMSKRAVQLKQARKVRGKRKPKKNLEGLYEILAPGSNIPKVSPTTSTIKEPGKPTVTVRYSDIAKYGTTQESQTPLNVYADRRGPRTCENLVEEKIQSYIKQFTRKSKGDKKMKHRKRDPGSGVSSSRSMWFHARWEGEFRKSQTLLLSEIKLFYSNLNCQANWLFQNNRLPHRHFKKWIPLQHTANVPQIEIH